MSISIKNIHEDQIASTKYYNYRSSEIGRLPSGKSADGHSSQANYLMSSNGAFGTTDADLKSFDDQSYQVNWGEISFNRYRADCGSDGDSQLTMSGMQYATTGNNIKIGDKKSFSDNSNSSNWGTQGEDRQFERNASCSNGDDLMDQGGWESSKWRKNSATACTSFSSDSTSTYLDNTLQVYSTRFYPISVSDGDNAILAGGYYTDSWGGYTQAYSEIRSFSSQSQSTRHSRFGKSYVACGGSNGVSAMRCGGTNYNNYGYSYPLSSCDICSFSSDAQSVSSGTLTAGRKYISSGSDGISLLIGGGNNSGAEKKGFDNQNSVLFGSLQVIRSYGTSSSGG